MAAQLPMKKPDKKALKDLMTSLEKSYGSAFELGDPNEPLEVLPTGSLALDIALGIGGWPRGRVSVLAGKESSGKTSMALKAVASVQKMGGIAAYVDTEHSLSPRWATMLGVDMDDIVWIKAHDLEAAGNIACQLAESGEIDLIVFDSVAGAPIKAVASGELGESNMGRRAKIMSDFAARICGPVSKNRVYMLFINQLRDSLNPYAPRPVMPGGRALAFHASIIALFDGKREKSTKSDPSYIEIRVDIEKSKLASPGTSARFILDFAGQIDPVDELATVIISHAETLGVVQSGPWYTLPDALGGEKLQGKPKLLELLSERDFFGRALALVREKLIIPTSSAPGASYGLGSDSPKAEQPGGKSRKKADHE